MSTGRHIQRKTKKLKQSNMSVVATNLRERYEWLAEHLGQGRSPLREYMEKFNVSSQQFYLDRKAVLKTMQDRLDDDLEMWGRDLLERYEHVYEEAVKNRNLKVATKVIEDIANLKGLLSQRVEVKTDNNIELNWGIENEEEQS